MNDEWPADRSADSDDSKFELNDALLDDEQAALQDEVVECGVVFGIELCIDFVLGVGLCLLVVDVLAELAEELDLRLLVVRSVIGEVEFAEWAALVDEGLEAVEDRTELFKVNVG